MAYATDLFINPSSRLTWSGPLTSIYRGSLIPHRSPGNTIINPRNTYTRKPIRCALNRTEPLSPQSRVTGSGMVWIPVEYRSPQLLHPVRFRSTPNADNLSFVITRKCSTNGFRVSNKEVGRSR